MSDWTRKADKAVHRTFDEIRDLDGVTLLEFTRKWPPGTQGVALEVHDDWALIEIANPNGETLDIFGIELSKLQR
jgi:hypothetical protein